MSTRFVKGKARTELPRSDELQAVGTVEDRQPNHGRNGQFTTGNDAAADRRAKQAIAKILGLRSSDTVVAVVGKDAARVMGVVLRDMPTDAPTVRNLVAMLARHSAIGAYANVRADELGLDTIDGRAWLELGLRHFARAERLTVTALDVATRMAVARKNAGDAMPFDLGHALAHSPADVAPRTANARADGAEVHRDAESPAAGIVERNAVNERNDEP